MFELRIPRFHELLIGVISQSIILENKQRDLVRALASIARTGSSFGIYSPQLSIITTLLLKLILSSEFVGAHFTRMVFSYSNALSFTESYLLGELGQTYVVFVPRRD